jgi:Tol biopolymer transport system component
MKSVLAVMLAAAVFAAQPSNTSLTIEQLVDIKHPSGPMWAPDGRHVVFVWDRAGVSAIYVADAAISGGAASAPRQLADAGNQLAGAFWSTDGSALIIREAASCGVSPSTAAAPPLSGRTRTQSG